MRPSTKTGTSPRDTPRTPQSSIMLTTLTGTIDNHRLIEYACLLKVERQVKYTHVAKFRKCRLNDVVKSVDGKIIKKHPRNNYYGRPFLLTLERATIINVPVCASFAKSIHHVHRTNEIINKHMHTECAYR